MTAREQAEMHIFGQTVGKEIGDALIDGDVRRLTKTIQSAILAEREACAKICDDERLALFKSRKPGDDASVYKVRAWQIGDIAAAIRARSNAPETEKEIIVQMSPKSRQAVIISPAPELPNKAVEPGFDDQMTVEREVYLKTCT